MSGTLEIISRKDAHARGDVFFFTGRPCRVRGHVGRRYVSNGCCVACFSMFKRKVGSGVTLDMMTFRPEKLVAPSSYTREDLIKLRHYLQTCVYAYTQRVTPTLVTPGITLAMEMHVATVPELHYADEIP